jgi:hypothetical protein
MRTDTRTIQPTTTLSAPSDAMPKHAFGASAARFLPLLATVLATSTAVLLACGLAVAMNLS